MATQPKTSSPFTAKQLEMLSTALSQYEASLRRGINSRQLASVKRALDEELKEVPALRAILVSLDH